jgi:Ala-tRNA(Pro) deacylase
MKANENFRNAYVPPSRTTMSLSSLKEYLDKNAIEYTVISHSPAFTAQGIAAMVHVPGQELVKTVVIKVDGELVMAVLPASFRVDLTLFEKETGARKAELASEAEFRETFPECETGAMPPFGNLYGLRVFADESLTRDNEIAFNACSHRELIRMSWRDLQRLARPRIARFAARRSAEAA